MVMAYDIRPRNCEPYFRRPPLRQNGSWYAYWMQWMSVRQRVGGS